MREGIDDQVATLHLFYGGWYCISSRDSARSSSLAKILARIARIKCRRTQNRAKGHLGYGVPASNTPTYGPWRGFQVLIYTRKRLHKTRLDNQVVPSNDTFINFWITMDILIYVCNLRDEVPGALFIFFPIVYFLILSANGYPFDNSVSYVVTESTIFLSSVIFQNTLMQSSKHLLF